MAERPDNPDTPRQPLSAAKEAALTAMAGWVATIADNVNNPVAGITAAIDLIDREFEALRAVGSCNEELVADSLRRIKKRLRNLSEYVTELAAFAKPAVPSPRAVDVRAFFRQLGRELAGAGDLDLSFAVEAGAESLVADPARLRVALLRLIDNAAQAAAQQAVPCVAVRAQVDGGAGVVLTVDDNGPGFSSAASQRAGEAFFSTKEAGTGLGLAIVKKFAEAHGGALRIGDSPTLGGARATIYLPKRD